MKKTKKPHCVCFPAQCLPAVPSCWVIQKLTSPLLGFPQLSCKMSASPLPSSLAYFQSSLEICLLKGPLSPLALWDLGLNQPSGTWISQSAALKKKKKINALCSWRVELVAGRGQNWQIQKWIEQLKRMSIQILTRLLFLSTCGLEDGMDSPRHGAACSHGHLVLLDPPPSNAFLHTKLTLCFFLLLHSWYKIRYLLSKCFQRWWIKQTTRGQKYILKLKCEAQEVEKKNGTSQLPSLAYWDAEHFVFFP